MIRKFFTADERTVIVSWLPLFHDMGLVGMMVESLYCGGQAVLMSPFSFLRGPALWLNTISRFRGVVTGAPDFGYALAARRLTDEQCRGLDLSSLRVAFNGAEPVRARTLREFTDRFAPYGFRAGAFRPCYGLAETTLLVSGGYTLEPPRVLRLDAGAFEQRKVVPARDGNEVSNVSCGPIDYGDQDVRIVDAESGTECRSGEVGEIWVAGSHVARRYWNNDEATAAAFHASLPDGAGPYLRTGDLGFVLEGHLHVAGRIKDLIIVDGSNHYPQDIEQTVEESHEAVRPGGVVAFAVAASDLGGGKDESERVVVIAELRDAPDVCADAERRAIADAIRGAVSMQHGLALADLKLARAGSILKTTSGKVERQACRREYLAQLQSALA
jgi:acyl-CoA synthetase (AMP-forming)/AMP-acid ligase II